MTDSAEPRTSEIDESSSNKFAPERKGGSSKRTRQRRKKSGESHVGSDHKGLCLRPPVRR
jgi:hypothetical protein